MKNNSTHEKSENSVNFYEQEYIIDYYVKGLLFANILDLKLDLNLPLIKLYPEYN